ncbi:MAG TPA: FecR domain-containing protein [Rhizomicrobium sp.]|jgi:transmembrane sensor|nr:FecR domain-containing protein [Rhizomicrobium sp.]
MSEQANSEAMHARHIKARAAAWLERRHFWDWGAEDQAALDAWRAESPAHEVAYLRMEAAWDRTERLTILRSAEAEAPPPRKKTRWSSRIAIGLAIAAMLVASGTYYVTRPVEKTYATALGGRQIVRLADGTSIELNTDTVLRTEMSDHARRVFLERGEAYFQIKHDAARPFTATAGDQTVTDVGTKFVMRRGNGKLEVSVVEGRVQFDAEAGHRLLAQGDVAIATADKLSVAKQPEQRLTNALGWRHGVLVFDHTTLADAAAEINRYNRAKLIVADQAAARLTIDGTFPTTNIAAFTEAAEEVFRLRVEKQGDETVVSR